jgi:phenylalanyl-tRNA synthetase alpha chain
MLKETLLQMKNEVIERISNAKTTTEVDDLRVEFLGKKGKITDILKGLKDLSVEEKKEIGKLANDVKVELEEKIEATIESISEREIEEKLARENFDITFPGNEVLKGSLHPITVVQRRAEEIFKGMGFMIADGPEIEEDKYNFEMLNIPKDHPARDMQDTYYLSTGNVLRTQTSACQSRFMLKVKPPFRMIAPGRCFRNEAMDASHENTFFQLEGMMVEKDLSIANLVYIMKTLLTEILEREVEVRLRPGFFPFVEPGFELDINCLICGGKGCPTCKHSGWIELLPCGMVHPNVLRAGGIDPEEYKGFAFGVGLTRLAMMKYGIKDIRELNSGDLRFLRK